MLRDIFGTHFAPSRNAEMHLTTKPDAGEVRLVIEKIDT